MIARAPVRLALTVVSSCLVFSMNARASDGDVSPPSAAFPATPAPSSTTAPTEAAHSQVVPSSPSSTAAPPGSVAPPGAPGSSVPQTTVPQAPAQANAPADYERARLEWERAYAAWYASGWRPPPTRRWYGWQTLLVDVASLGLWVGGALSSDRSSSSYAVTLTGVVGYEFAAPIVHAAHGHWDKAGGSVGLRLGTTILGVAGALGCSSGRVSDCDGGYGVLLVLGGLGLFAVPIIDAVVIANEDIESGEEAGLKLVPWIASPGRGGGLSVGRRF